MQVRQDMSITSHSVDDLNTIRCPVPVSVLGVCPASTDIYNIICIAMPSVIRTRWTNQDDPRLKKDKWSVEEEYVLILVSEGSRVSFESETITVFYSASCQL